MRAVVVHAVVGGHQHLVAGIQPPLQVVGEDHVGAPRGVAVLRRIQAITMAGVVDVHRVHQQQVGAMALAQAVGIGEQVRIRVVVGVVEVAVLDRQGRIAGVAVAGGDEGRAVVQLAHPVIGRGGGGQAGVTGIVEDAALLGQAHHVVVHHAAVDRRNAGHDAFVERARQRRQFAFEAVQRGTAGGAVGVQMAQGMPGDLVVETVEHDQNDFVFHRDSPQRKRGVVLPSPTCGRGVGERVHPAAGQGHDRGGAADTVLCINSNTTRSQTGWIGLPSGLIV